MIQSQQALETRLAELERVATRLSGRLDEIHRTDPNTSDYVETDPHKPARSPEAAKTPSPAPAAGPTHSAPDPDEMLALQRDVGALTAAISRLASSDEHGAAAIRARLERLELRTSKLAWPPASSPVKALHLASYRTHEAALAGWEILAKRYGKQLGSETPTLVEVRTVAGQYVRLFTGVGHDEVALIKLREAIRNGGDYAMILPMPGAPGS